jgi:hypothetical protein
MAVQPNTSTGLPFWDFVTITFLQGWIVSPAPNPEPGGPGLRIYDLRRQGGPAMLPGTGYPHFSRLLRHDWVTVRLFSIPATTREYVSFVRPNNTSLIGLHSISSGKEI